MYKIGTDLHIKTGAGVGSEMVFTANTYTSMIYDGDLNLLSKLKLTNISDQSSTIQHLGTNLNVIANNNTSSDINFFTDSLGVNKLHIKKDTDEIEVKNLKVLGTTDTNSVISNQLNVTNASGQSALFIHDGQELNITSNMSAGTPSDIHFFTEPNEPSKLSILRNTDTVQMVNLNVQDGIECSDILTEDIICNDINTSNISTINISISTNALFGTTASIGSNLTNFNFNSSNDYKFSTTSAQESVFFREGLGYGLIETDRINISTINSSAIVTDAITTTTLNLLSTFSPTNISTSNITVSNLLNFDDSRISESATKFDFLSGSASTGKDFKFETGIANETVHFKTGLGKGLLETSNINTSLLFTETLNISGSMNFYDPDSSQDLTTYFDDTGEGPDYPTPNIIFPAAFILSGQFTNYNIYNMMAFNNNSTRANRFIEVSCPFNISNDLVVNGTNVITEIATKQDLLTAGTGITIVNNVISSTGGGGNNLTAGTNIDITNNIVSTTPNVEFTNSTTTGVLYVKDSTNVHEVLEYWNPAQSQFFKRSYVNDDYDMFDMLIFNNDATPANRSINVSCDMTVAGDLVVNGTNVETQIATKQDTLTAGAGITIDANNEISYSGASPVTYTEGLNISINAQDEIETVIDPVFDQVDAGSTSIGGLSGAATFHHVSLPNFSDHALTQYSTGVTILNCKAGQQISLRQGQVQKAKIDNAGDFHIMRNGTLTNLPTELDQIQSDLVTKQVNLTAGANIALDSFGNISSTDTTYTAGTNIAIDAGNVISSTDTTYTAGENITIDVNNVVSADSPLARISYYRLGGFTTIPNGTITDYFQNAFTTSHNNLSIPFTTQTSANASSGWFLVQGTYKFEYKVCFDNGSYNDRLGVRARFYFGAAYNLSADAHGYARASTFIDRQTVNSNFIYTIPAGGQHMRIFHNCARNSVSYNDVWDSNAQIYGLTLIITRLD
tara:strand:- start:1391 stop:4276 length:2886 start_codon:yes stop_codon:yes gene_type:complete